MSSPPPSRPAPAGRPLWTSAILLGGLALGLLLLGGSLVSHEAARAALRAAAGEGLARRYRPDLHAGLAPRLRLLGAALLFGTGLAWPLRRRLAGAASRAAGQLAADLRQARQGWRSLRVHPATCAGLLALVAAAALVRLPFLGQPARYDEATTQLGYASKPLYEIVSRYDTPNNHVLHTLAAAASCRLLGDDLWALRLPAFLAGVLLVPACYLAARALYDRPTAWLAAALVAVSSLLVEYSTNARGYTLQALLTLLLVALSCRLLDSPTLLGWCAWAALAALGFWAVPTMLYPFAGLAAWLALCGGRRFLGQLLGACILAGALTVALYLPILLLSGPGALVGNRFVQPLTPARWAHELPASLAETFRDWHRDLPAWLAAVLAAGFLAALAAHRRLGRQPVPLAAVLAACCLLLTAAQRVAPFPRVWLFALPVYLITAAAGVAAAVRLVLPQAARPVAVAGLVAAAVLLLGWRVAHSPAVLESTQTGTLRDGAEVAALLEDRLSPGDLVIASSPSDGVLMYHFHRRDLPLDRIVYDELPEGWHGARLLVVVNKAHDQTLEGVAEKHGLEGRADVSSARLVGDWATASVYEVEAKRK
jgi:hypothetical protein